MHTVNSFLAYCAALAWLVALAPGCGQVAPDAADTNAPSGTGVNGDDRGGDADPSADGDRPSRRDDDGDSSGDRDEAGHEDCSPVEPGAEWLSSLELPAVTRTTFGPEYAIVDGERSTPERIAVSQSVRFALGPDYPTTMALELGAVFGECGALADIGQGAFTIEAIDVTEGSARVAQVDAETLTIEVDEAGLSLVEVTGLLTISESEGPNCVDAYDGQLTMPVTYFLQIRAEPIMWPIELRSSCPALAQAGNSLPVSINRLTLDGEMAWAHNVQQPALALSTTGSVRVHMPSTGAGLLSELVTSGSGTLRITVLDDTGQSEPSSVEIRILDASEIDHVHFEYELVGPVGRSNVALENGESYNARGRAEEVLIEARWMYSGGVGLCGSPRAEDFWVTSLTPDTCEVTNRTCSSQESWRGWLLQSAPILADGTCSLRIEAPEYAGGAGLSTDFSVTLSNTRGLR